MLRAMIVDDEAPARSELRYLLEETGRVDAITEASSAREAVERLMEARADVIFLDVSMPKTNGMQLAEALHKLKNPPAVVFVTAYSEYALEAFDVDAIDYLMKPVETDRLNQALDKVQSRVTPQPQSHSSVERIPVVKSGRKVLVPIDQIRYIEAKDDYSCIYTDVDGVYDKDPRKFADAVKYPYISYEKMLDLARSGAQVLHDRSVEIARQYGVRVRVLSSFRPGPGTIVGPVE